MDGIHLLKPGLPEKRLSYDIILYDKDMVLKIAMGVRNLRLVPCSVVLYRDVSLALTSFMPPLFRSPFTSSRAFLVGQCQHDRFNKETLIQTLQLTAVALKGKRARYKYLILGVALCCTRTGRKSHNSSLHSLRPLHVWFAKTLALHARAPMYARKPRNLKPLIKRKQRPKLPALGRN